MRKKTQIILVPASAGDYRVYRIAKLINGVSVKAWWRRSNNEYHVGDTIDEATAKGLSASNQYEVTVTKQGGSR